MSVQEREVWQALSTVQEPELHRDLVSLNMIRELKISPEGRVSLTVVLTTPACPLKGLIRADVERAVSKVAGVTGVDVDMTANVTTARRPAPGDLTRTIRNVIGIASGKGGVGKSTVSINLACALAVTGARVGLLDADIYGPNQPIMAGLLGEQPVVEEETLPNGEKTQFILPIERHGVRFMSMGFLVAEDQPVVWRGPMLNSALRQFLGQVKWGELDYLVVDLPPGTGDVHISLAQLAKVTGIVHVTTPQDVALQDVRKGIAMFSGEGIRIPHLGIVENMSGYCCPECGHRSDIFGTGGGRRTSEVLGIPFLGDIPLREPIREGGDTGRPVVMAQPDSDLAERFRKIAEGLAAEVSKLNFRQTGGMVAHVS
jgi:ATP-binding protein involved in chromosome partitioning